MADSAFSRTTSFTTESQGSSNFASSVVSDAYDPHTLYSGPSNSLDDLSHGDLLAKQSDATVGGAAVPPETEYFGFALYVGSFCSILVYILWAYLPRSVLQALGIYYYPSRWWALAVPAYIAVSMGYIYVALAAYNTEVLTRPAWELRNVTDPVARIVPGRMRVSEPNQPNFYYPQSSQSRRNSTIDEVTGSEDDNGELAFPIYNGGKKHAARGRASIPQTPTTRSTTASPFSSPHSSTINLPTMAVPPSSSSQMKMSLDHYLFNPSDGVWDLPLSEVCNILYSKPQ